MTRREFFLSWLIQDRTASIEVEVIEVFATSHGVAALLVHHVSERTRIAFGKWLRANDGGRIAGRLRNGTVVNGEIFRVRMCFGRGLIITQASVPILAKDILIIN
jgi:hypothetical protein